ncbi:hypothetical protein TVAG_116280 [Trichomonas vaginalis G3]|uniref:Glycosyltransferase 61 catalytic domain-containing protein n=1 Tax=Trichomonas vaginalis (strain ATCC PRA-98 / G3) TaxID=412133 RepID=A2EXR4_TRIV3|nr:glycosyltransferase family [Trichomonas vaginalis G3]EAY02574.1 hypothetical protein TVAG_116280 [Trichomonas vaginalis G3]KAI5552035.1 glycosyltransferase family [Trichomonas vaginalis G3]|eukprot:XP_001330710.1 hypothetical protein [Trichomonas vaginalis G3]
MPVSEIYNTKLITYMPEEIIESKTVYDIPIDIGDTQLRMNGKWSDVDDHPAKPVVLPEKFQRFKGTMAILKNIYVNRNSGILLPGKFIVPTNDSWYYETKRPDSGRVIATYDNCVCFGHGSTRLYGHWMVDYLSMLMLLPKEVLKAYKLINVPDIKGAHETLDFLNVPKENRIPYPQGYDLYFLRRCYYMYDPLTMTNHYGLPLQRIRDFLHEKFQLDGIEKTKYCCYQRNARRKIINFDEMFNTLKKEFKEYKWECIKDHQSLTQCARYWAAIKLIISGNGSHYFRCFCMNKGAVAVEVHGVFHDLSCLGAIIMCGVHCITLKNPELTHHVWWGGGSYNMEIKKIVKTVKYLKPYLSGGQFPSGPLVF